MKCDDSVRLVLGPECPRWRDFHVSHFSISANWADSWDRAVSPLWVQTLVGPVVVAADVAGFHFGAQRNVKIRDDFWQNVGFAEMQANWCAVAVALWRDSCRNDQFQN